MANAKLASKAVGDIVKLKVNGAAKEFIVVHQGSPGAMYDESCNGTWLLMKDIYENRQWNSSNSNVYETSTVNTYLNGPFLGLFDSNIQGIIKQVKIPYRKGGGNGTDQSGANGLSCKAFLLSTAEVGISGGTNGAKLDYFVAGTDGNSKRIANLNGVAAIWGSRSVYPNLPSGTQFINASGSLNTFNSSESYGIRPALILPFNMEVDDSGNVVSSTRPMKLSEMPVGGTVKIKVNGTEKDFLVVQQGKPSDIYDDSCDGVWLLMKDIYESRSWHSSNVNKLESSTIHSYLNGTFLGLLESNIQKVIKQAKIPYRSGGGSGGTNQNGVNGLATKIFLLSVIESGFNASWSQNFPVDGASLDYFNGTTWMDSKRVAYYNGSAAEWWLRSPDTSLTTNGLAVSSNGGYSGTAVTTSYGIRPAFILPKTVSIADDFTLVTNTAPTISSTSGASGVNLGTKAEKFNFVYTPSDVDGDALTVTEKLDGVVKKTRTGVASGTALTFECASTADGFQQILNGSHVITVEVSDGKETATFTANFTKAVYEASIALNEPFAVAGDITVAVMNIVGELPSDAVLKVEVTNNAKDDSPVWQDATDEVLNGRNIAFLNNTAVNGAAFSFRMSVKRGASNTGGYINTITGAFQ